MLSGISIWQLLILLTVVVLIFGTRKLRNLGSDLGGAVKGFKDAVREGENEQHRKQVTDERGPTASDAAPTDAERPQDRS